mmetsp:Transcript_54496/g.129925  ORF Transcript_54496/g.129925 Transcript_54496/m.129925 type:complete len:331 (-) Transcript_54496:56-1048(-)
MLVTPVATEEPGSDEDDDELIHGPIISADLSWRQDEPEERKRSFTTLGVCCLCSVVLIGVALALLSRLATEGNPKIVLEPMVLAVFSFGSDQLATPRNQALAWVTSQILKGKPMDTISTVADSSSTVRLQSPAVAAFIPDGTSVLSWRPTEIHAEERTFIHGEVAAEIQDKYKIPASAFMEVKDATASYMAETDTFLYIHRHLDKQANRNFVAPKAVIISHPHHLPFLVVLAAAQRFQPLVIESSILSHMEWSNFGCTPLGYSPQEEPEETLRTEQSKLNTYASELSMMDPEQFQGLSKVIEVANATLQYYQCAIKVNASDTTLCTQALP